MKKDYTRLIAFIGLFVMLFALAAYGLCKNDSGNDRAGAQESVSGIKTEDTQNDGITDISDSGNDTPQDISDNDANNEEDTSDFDANYPEDVTGAHVLSINTDDFTVDLIVYLKFEAQGIPNSDVSNSLLTLPQDELFKASGRFHWWSQPESLTGKLLVLPNDYDGRGQNELFGEPTIRYTIAEEYELYFDEYTLAYDNEKDKVTITKTGQVFAELELEFGGTRFSPHAFFVDDDDSVALWCNTRGEGYSDAGIHPVTLVYAWSGESYRLETINDHASIFEDFDLNILMMPALPFQDKAIQICAQDKTFLWNESQKIVKVNPYDGCVDVIIDENKIKADMPFLNTTRESYDFFWGAGCQNGVYLAMFPNYNNTEGTFVVFYNGEGEFLGSVLCSEDRLSVTDRDYVEISCIENIALKPLLYIPQEQMN